MFQWISTQLDSWWAKLILFIAAVAPLYFLLKDKEFVKNTVKSCLNWLKTVPQVPWWQLLLVGALLIFGYSHVSSVVRNNGDPYRKWVNQISFLIRGIPITYKITTDTEAFTIGQFNESPKLVSGPTIRHLQEGKRTLFEIAGVDYLERNDQVNDHVTLKIEIGILSSFAEEYRLELERTHGQSMRLSTITIPNEMHAWSWTFLNEDRPRRFFATVHKVVMTTQTED